MAFLIYRKQRDDQRVRYERLQPLRLSGRDGLISRHIDSLTEVETPSWRLSTASLLTLAGFAEHQDLTVVFDLSRPETTCLYELVRINGSCRDVSTQLALEFAVVLDQETGPDAGGYTSCFEVASTGTPKLLSELLALSGGPGGGDWKWSPLPMQIGATVVPARPGKPV
jgi:hypothetical protein